MTEVAYHLAIAALLVLQMWVGFIAVMHLRRARNKWGLSTTQKLLACPVLAFYWLLDVALRATLFCVLFLCPPRIEWVRLGRHKIPLPETISALLAREALQGQGWRQALAIWIREDWLAEFDPTGAHGQPGRE